MSEHTPGDLLILTTVDYRPWWRRLWARVIRGEQKMLPPTGWTEIKNIELLRVGDVVVEIDHASPRHIEISQHGQVVILNEMEWVRAMRDWFTRVLEEHDETK